MSRPGPQARATTVRAALEAALAEAPEAGLTARELSGAVGIPEKDVAEHLLHLDKSLKALGGRLEVLPAECLACGFVFRDRKRFTRPGACPQCRATRIDAPAFRLGA
ncbi:MAG TPA: transcriptional regulator [Myxococcaceae bacterium]|nr:transcriptional regulator [Myxococcaceae bacterium]